MYRIALITAAALVAAAATLMLVLRPSIAGSTGPAVAPPPVRPLATVTGTQPGVKLGLLSLRRFGPKAVTAKLRIYADRTAEVDRFDGHVQVDLGDDGTVDGIRLVDEVNGSEQAPLRDDAGACLCSWVDGIRPGGSIDVYAKFPSPRDDVDRVSLHVPTFPSFDDVRIDSLD